MSAMPRDLLAPDYESGWKMAGRGGFRRLGDGVVESFGGSGLWWYADEVFEDFSLVVEWRITHPDDNSGVFIRSPALTADYRDAIAEGYEVQIDDRGIDPQAKRSDSPLHLTGAVYRLAPALSRASRPCGEWNRFDIRATGPRIEVDLNGALVSVLESGTRRRVGHLALQAHHQGSAVQFRHLIVV